ncbi:hypothetical protein [Methylomonas sp. MgM2]
MYALKPLARYWPLLWAIWVPVIYAGTVPDPGEVSAIEVRIEPDNLEQFGFDLSAIDLADRVRLNLAEWNYPLPDKGPYSHQLQVNIGEIVHSETPVGFSFSSGNSNPRALDFQKADVLPIECVFGKQGGEDVIAESKSTYSARPFAKGHGSAEMTDKLIDLISTTCFNLLEELPKHQPNPQTSTTTFEPKWMPDVRVEVKETPVVKETPAVPGTPVQGTDKTESKTETGGEVTKEIIIHNQGTPLIFKFGHDRL